MVMEALRQGAKGGLGKFILMGFMSLAVGGLVLMDMGGFFRGGVANSDVAKIGGQTISASAFDSTLRRSLSQVNLTPEQAYKMGYTTRVLNAEISNTILAQSAYKNDVSISDEAAAQYISRMIAPMVGVGGDAKSTLERLLAAQGMSEAGFVASIKNDLRNSLLADSMRGGFASVSDSTARDLYRVKNEKRDVSYVVFKNDAVRDVAPPSDDQLNAVYERTKEQYAAPETRNVQLIVLNTDALREKIDVSDSVLKQRYDAEKDFYTINQSWTIDQALFDDVDTAQAVYARVDSGSTMIDAVRSVTGASTAYIGEKSFEESDLPEALKEQVVAQEIGDIIAPLSTAMGVYVIKVTDYTPAGVQSFDAVKSEIKKDLFETQVIDQLYDQASVVDDILAGGASVDDVKEQVDIHIIALDNLNVRGQTTSTPEIEGFADMRQDIATAAFSLAEGETSPMQEMRSGQFMAVHTAIVMPKTYEPFIDVKDNLTTQWTADQKMLSNRMRVKSILEGGVQGLDLGAIAQAEGHSVQRIKGLVRTEVSGDASSKNDFPISAVQTVFAAPKAAPVIIDLEGGYGIASVDDVIWSQSIDDKALMAFKTDLIQQQQDDVMTVYLNTKRDEYGVKVNDGALARLYTPTEE